LFGKAKEWFWHQAYTDLLKVVNFAAVRREGEEGLALTATSLHNGILLDLHMSNMNGNGIDVCLNR
jgi:hypothetical protein